MTIVRTRCAYPGTDGQTELAYVAGYVARCILRVQQKLIKAIYIVNCRSVIDNTIITLQQILKILYLNNVLNTHANFGIRILF